MNFRALCMLSLTLVATPVPQSAEAQANFCDPALTYSRGDSEGYRLRAGRCEGRYRTRNSGESFAIVGYISGQWAFTPRAVRQIQLTWPASDGSAVRIQAISLNPLIPYRMDTRVGPPAQVFAWPTEVLRAVDLTGESLGLRAWATSGPGGKGDSVLVPLRIANSGSDPALRVVIYSVRVLNDVRLAVRHPQTGRIIVPATLKASRLSGGRPFEVSLPATLPPGRYRIEISATQTDGVPASDSAMVLVPPAADAP